MKKTMKGLLSVGLCLALGLVGGVGLVACDDPEEAAVTPGEKSDYYMVGHFSDPTLPQDSGDWEDQHCETKDDVDAKVSFVTTATANVYELTVQLYEGDQFQILIVGQGWGNQMGGKTFPAFFENDEDGNFTKHNSFPVDDIQAVNSGKYKFTLTVTDSEKTLSYERESDAAKLPVHVTSVTITESDFSLAIGGEKTLHATVAPDDADVKTITWSSSDESVATVDQTGKVTAVAAGTCDITATGADSKSASVACTVAADVVDVDSVSLNKSETTLHCGQTETLVATVLPANATTQTVTYSSADATVATVNATTGEITAVKPGTVVITVTGDNEKTDTCTVTVPKDYYLRGDMMGWDPAVAVVGQANIIYFTEITDQPGKYTTGEVTIKNGHQFKVASVAEGWDNQVGAEKCSNMTDLSAYFDQVGDMGGDKFKCKDTAKYTFVLDTTGDNDSLTVTWNSDLPDDIDAATGLGVWGTAVTTGWGGPEEADRVTLTKGADGKWTGTLANVVLSTGEWQLRYEADGTTKYGDYGIGADKITVPSGIEKAASSNNINVTAGGAGTYNITITVSSVGEIESIVVEAAA